MYLIKVKITRYIDSHYPGFIECKFHDAWNKEHTVHEKVPIVTDNDLDANSHYPQDGFIACEIIKEWKDKNERIIFTVTTNKPDGVDSVDGLNEFDLAKDELIELKP